MPENLNREISIVYDLLFGYTDKMKGLRNELDIGQFKLPVDAALVIKINNYELLTADISEFRKEEIQQDILTNLNNLACNYSQDILSALIEEDMLVLFYSADFIEEENSKEKVVSFGEYLKENLEEKSEYTYSIGLGRIYDNLKGLIFSYKEALNVCKSCYFREKNSVMHIDEMVKFTNDVPIFISEMETKLIDKIESANLENIDYYFLEIVNSIMEEKLEPDTVKIKILDFIYRIIEEINEVTEDEGESFYELSSFMREILQAETERTMRKYIQKIGDKLFTILRKSKGDSSSKYSVNQALDYIENNYNKELSLKKVSKKVGLSLYYFSHLFKEEVGVSFVTYLNKFRIKKAKEFLVNSKMNIAEISFEVGYNDPNYFTRVFKEYEDLTPSEFRIKKESQPKF
ncbi:MAG TPA: helix-turn-helix domain-containing protein [Halanaerobiales bacterium]|nr:helix-turn-helix domain-containing protein [Halanaerobiales bacterium]